MRGAWDHVGGGEDSSITIGQVRRIPHRQFQWGGVDKTRPRPAQGYLRVPTAEEPHTVEEFQRVGTTGFRLESRHRGDDYRIETITKETCDI